MNNPAVEFDADVIEAGIDLQDLRFDIGRYVDGDFQEFYRFFDNNPLLGVKLLRMGAENEQGHADAQFKLGICYEKDLGVEEEVEEAIEWHQQASDQGNQDAFQALRDVNKRTWKEVQNSVADIIEMVKSFGEDDF